MSRLRITGCPVLVGDSDRFLLYITVECREGASCVGDDLVSEVEALLSGGPAGPRAVALVYGGLVLLYKSEEEPVPISRAQISGGICIEPSGDGGPLGGDDDILRVVASVFRTGRLGRPLTGRMGGRLVVLRECEEAPCRAAPTGVLYG